MFAAPPEIQARVFARLPDKFRVVGRRNRWIDEQRGGAPTASFLEGPSFDLEGTLFVVDLAWGRIFTVSPEGQFDLYTEYDGEPNGLKIHADGRIFVADFRHGIMVIDPKTRAVRPVLAGSPAGRFKGVNDLVFARNGDLYFTDQGLTGLHDPSGSLYRLRADGRLDQLLSNIPSPNGLVLDAEERTVYVNVTRGNCVWRVPMTREGWPYKVGVFIQMSGGLGGPDGIAADAEGNLAVAHFGLGSVWLYSKLGEPLLRIRSPEGLATTNVAFGGSGQHTLFITESESGCILRAEVPVAGRPMFSHA